MESVDIYKLYQEYPIICTDTRKITRNCLFFALKGANFNGNSFADQALELGAAFAIVDEDIESDKRDRIIKVEDVLVCLQEVARIHRSMITIPVIGITGSNGKTTTKELLNAVLAKRYMVHCTQGNLNNHIGVPLSLLHISEYSQISIIEMGTNSPGEIEFLSDLSQPTCGIITSIGKAHLEGLGSIEGVLREKTALYRHVAKKGGVIFYNPNDTLLSTSLPNETSNLPYCKDLEYQVIKSFPSIEMDFLSNRTIMKLNSMMYGEHNIDNVLAAISIGQHFGVGLQDCIDAINDYKPVNNRSQLIHFEGAKIYLDAYNANPASMAASIKSLAISSNDNIVLILGDMKELGVHSKEEHRKILDEIAKNKFYAVALFGTEFAKFREEFWAYHFFENFDALNSWFTSFDKMNTEILLKGSRSMGLERLLMP